MAVSSGAAATSSCGLRRSVSVDTPRLCFSWSLSCSPLRGVNTKNRRLSAVSRRQIFPQVEAKKETFSSFDDLLKNSDKPMLVDFYTTWCGPCQFMAPVLDEVSIKLKDRIQVVKINTEKYRSILNRYGIAALPTFIMFRDGEPCDRFKGALLADQFIQHIENALKVAK